MVVLYPIVAMQGTRSMDKAMEHQHGISIARLEISVLLSRASLSGVAILLRKIGLVPITAA